MSATAAQITTVRAAALALPFTAAAQTVEFFIAQSLNIHPGTATVLMNAPPRPILAELESLQEELFVKRSIVPPFCTYIVNGTPMMAGVSTRLDSLGPDASIVSSRLFNHNSIRARLLGLTDGHHLEAITAALFDEALREGVATQGSGDQGIDAIGILESGAFDWISAVRNAAYLNDAVVHYLASSKATIGNTSPSLLKPEKIRELVGGWIIQRTASGVWSGHGIKPLSPVRMVLATTYRLSDASWLLAQQLGIQVWSLPELVGMICRFAPAQVFPAPTQTFDVTAFNSWWNTYDTARVVVP